MKRLSFQTRLVVSFMLVITVALAAILWSSSLFIRNRMLSEKQNDLILKGTEIAKKIAVYTESTTPKANLSEILSDMDSFLAARIWVLDANRQLVEFSGVMHSGSQRPFGMGMGSGRGSGMGRKGVGGNSSIPSSMPGALRNFIAELDSVYRGETWSKVIEHPYYEERMVVVGVPVVLSNGKVNGAVVINSPVAAVTDFMRHLYLFIGLGAIVGIIFSFVVVRFLTRGLVRPLRSMQETTGAIARGDYSARVAVESADEIGQLGGSINQLAEDLGQFMLEVGKSEKLRRDFIANVSHELRTPLTVIRGYTEAIVDGTVDDRQQIDSCLHLVRDEAVRLERLIKSLLELSRLQSSNSSCVMTNLGLKEIADHVLQLIKPLAQSKHIELLLETTPNLPLIQGSRDRLVQLLLILLDNAVKYTPPYGSVTLGLRSEAPDTLICSVQDTGVGIPAEDLPYIWERFYKVDKSHQIEDRGTGLGLAIAKQIIDLHQAKVQVTSELGAGTRIDLKFQTVAATEADHVLQFQ
ncbi:MAG: sensor histidine kinase [Negativicutes bacterium]